ncbi:DUF1714 domain-containing protein [Coprinopsis sp. MPI-PUGE-AT-0042]|nr:DUF1714 domain-containing protein [Coprinopsis sp. MPI-PUGE-AT-0042]KAH6911366.1 DUF1714 domain-containing protein [Coprinopsis sp. MPI-PUGE-AT-0042]
MTNLRDALLAALAKLPGTREFHLHVLVSAPRKTTALYPFARPRPRAYLQDVLILLSEQTTPDSPRLIVSAIEAAIFNLPATSSAVLYVSKVDSTGHSKGKAPTAALVRAFLGYYADPITRPVPADHLWIQLFARAQAQYLFPNSADFSGKKPLTDIRLCAWWKRLLSGVAADLQGKVSPEPEKEKTKVKAYYVLPGYSQLEAENAVRIAAGSIPSLPDGIAWHYGHPYSQKDIPSPCPLDSAGFNLGNYIPWLDDDPKSRFLDEIAYTSGLAEGIKSPPRKRSRTNPEADEAGSSVAAADDKTSKANNKEDKVMGELGKVTADEFWERMSFRQECVAGAVTGFFTLVISRRGSGSGVSPLAPQPGQVSTQINKRIMTSLLTGVEFSTLERAIRATETIESAIKGLCEGISVVPSSSDSAIIKPTIVRSERRTPEPTTSSLLVPPSTPPRNASTLPEVSPNPFPEPVASLETYRSYIYGCIAVNNPVPVAAAETSAEAAASTPHVTVLAVRKKKKRT